MQWTYLLNVNFVCYNVPHQSSQWKHHHSDSPDSSTLLAVSLLHPPWPVGSSSWHRDPQSGQNLRPLSHSEDQSWKEQFRSAYAVPLIQATKFCSWPSFFKSCDNIFFFLWIEDSTLVALNCAMHTCLKNRHMVFMEASVAFVVASFTPAAPSSVKAFLC